MNIESALAKALERVPTLEEKQRLLRLRDAFDIRDNDALWALVGVQEYYNALQRQHPERSAAAVRQALKEGLSQLAGPLPSPGPGARPAPRSGEGKELYGCIVAASHSLTAALGMLVGAQLTGGHPCWVERTAASSIAVNLLAAPLGWLVSLLLLVPAAHAAAWGWRRGREKSRPPLQRAVGWSVVAAIGGSLCVWGVLLHELVNARQ